MYISRNTRNLFFILIVLFFFFFKKGFVYLREKKREHEYGEGQRESKRENPQADYPLSLEPDRCGALSQDPLKSWPEPKSQMLG